MPAVCWCHGNNSSSQLVSPGAEDAVSMIAEHGPWSTYLGGVTCAGQQDRTAAPPPSPRVPHRLGRARRACYSPPLLPVRSTATAGRACSVPDPSQWDPPKCVRKPGRSETNVRTRVVGPAGRDIRLRLSPLGAETPDFGRRAETRQR